MSLATLFGQSGIGRAAAGMAPLAMPKKRGGMFGGADWASGIGALLSAISAGTGSPVGAMGLQMLNQRLGQKREDKRYERQRQDAMADWMAKQEYERANPAPRAPHYFEDNSGNVMAVGPDGKPTMIYKDPNPFKLVPNGMGGVVPVNMEELMKGVGKPAAPGVTFTPIEDEGGPRPLGVGGFPGPF